MEAFLRSSSSEIRFSAVANLCRHPDASCIISWRLFVRNSPSLRISSNIDLLVIIVIRAASTPTLIVSNKSRAASRSPRLDIALVASLYSSDAEYVSSSNLVFANFNASTLPASISQSASDLDICLLALVAISSEDFRSIRAS